MTELQSGELLIDHCETAPTDNASLKTRERYVELAEESLQTKKKHCGCHYNPANEFLANKKQTTR